MNRGALAALILREWRTSWTDRSAYVFRGVYAAALLMGAIAAWALLPTLRPDAAEEFPALLRSIFGWFCRAQFVLATALASLTFSRAVCREQERGTLDLLLLSPLTKLEILLAKLVGEFLGLAVLVLAGLPMVLLLIPLGGISPFEILSLQAILLAHLLGVGALSVAFAALLGRSFPVMLCTCGAVLLQVAGPGWALAWNPAGAWIWNSWESISPLHLLEEQLGSVSADAGFAGKALLVSALGALLFCGLGSLVLERRYLAGGRRSGRSALGRLLRRAASSRRVGWIFRPLRSAVHPLMQREGSMDRDFWFRLLWLGLVVAYGWAVRREFKSVSDWGDHLALSSLGLAVASMIVVVLGALSVGTDRRRGTLETLLAAGVAPEDLVRARWLGLFLRAICMLAPPAIHLAFVLAKEFSGEAFWRVPAALAGIGFAAAMMTGITLWFSLSSRRAEVAAFIALLTALPAAFFVALLLGGHVISLAMGLPLVIGALLSGYAALIRRVPRMILG